MGLYELGNIRGDHAGRGAPRLTRLHLAIIQEPRFEPALHGRDFDGQHDQPSNGALRVASDLLEVA